MRTRLRGPRVRSGRRRVSVWMAAALLFTLAAAVALSAAGAQPPTQQDEFVPIDELPPQDQLPAAPLLVGAYALFWLIVMGYLWTIRKRQATVEREIAELTRRVGAE